MAKNALVELILDAVASLQKTPVVRPGFDMDDCPVRSESRI